MVPEKFYVKNRKGQKLAAVLNCPSKSGKWPGVLLLHGFTGYKDEEHIVSIGDALASNGFAAVRFDASGFAESEGTMVEDYRVSNYVDDIECVLDALKGFEFVDSSHIGLWGHSMGGMLAIIIASRHPEIKAVCAVSAPTAITHANSLEGWLKEWKRKGFFEDESSRYGKYKIPYDFVVDSRKWDALGFIGRMHQSLLVIVGSEDDNVLPSDTKKLFEAAPGQKALIEIEHMGHDYKKFPEKISEVNSHIVDFLNRSLKG